MSGGFTATPLNSYFYGFISFYFLIYNLSYTSYISFFNLGHNCLSRIPETGIEIIQNMLSQNPSWTLKPLEPLEPVEPVVPSTSKKPRIPRQVCAQSIKTTLALPGSQLQYSLNFLQRNDALEAGQPGKMDSRARAKTARQWLVWQKCIWGSRVGPKRMSKNDLWAPMNCIRVPCFCLFLSFRTGDWNVNHCKSDSCRLDGIVLLGWMLVPSSWVLQHTQEWLGPFFRKKNGWSNTSVALLGKPMQAEAIWHGMARVFICV